MDNNSADIVFEDERWEEAGLEGLAARAFGACFAHLGMDPARYELALLACDDARIAVLNADFRAKPTPTNVLSWPAEERAPATRGTHPDLPIAGDGPPVELGDIAISYETCAAEADAAQKPLADHATHLLVHGFLHLLGYDHIFDEDAALMEAREAEILGTIGLSNPYE